MTIDEGGFVFGVFFVYENNSMVLFSDVYRKLTSKVMGLCKFTCSNYLICLFALIDQCTYVK